MDNLEKFFKNSCLHDYEICKLEIDYSLGTILFKFLDETRQLKSCLIDKFLYVSFDKKEPWGKGKYVVYSDIYSEDDTWVIEIQLNSGDTCKIVCNK